MRTTIQDVTIFSPSGLGRVSKVADIRRKPFTLTYATADNQAVTVQAVHAYGALYVSLSGGPFINGASGSTKEQAVQSWERQLAGSSFAYFTGCYQRYSDAARAI